MKILFLSIFLTACSTAPQDPCYKPWDIETKVQCSKRQLIQDERPIQVHESVKNYFGVK
jgi:hypothetical protein